MTAFERGQLVRALADNRVELATLSSSAHLIGWGPSPSVGLEACFLSALQVCFRVGHIRLGDSPMFL